jgi:hypothetical protein
MRTSSIFWGTLLIFLGIFFLLTNLGMIHLNLGWISSYWPLLLIIWGLSLLNIPRWAKNIMSAFSAILIALIIMSTVSQAWKGDFRFWKGMHHGINVTTSDDDEEGTDSTSHNTKKMVIAIDSTYTNGQFNFSGGAGEFTIQDTTSKLIDIEASGSNKDLICNPNKDNKTVTLDYAFDSNSKIFRNIDKERYAKIKLSPNILWDLNLKLGAATVNCDLSEYKMQSVTLNVGAADITIKLGDLAEKTNIDVKAGASDIKISIPNSSGCEIISKTSLSERDFNGFQSNGKDSYKTENFDNSSKKIYIKISGGISSFNVERY